MPDNIIHIRQVNNQLLYESSTVSHIQNYKKYIQNKKTRPGQIPREVCLYSTNYQYIKFTQGRNHPDK